MERFALKITGDELRDLIYQIQNYEIMPVYVSEDGCKSFHPINKGEEIIVVLFCWEDVVPLTVYRENWFDKECEKKWNPKPTTRITKAKDRRVRDRKRNRKFGALRKEFSQKVADFDTYW